MSSKSMTTDGVKDPCDNKHTNQAPTSSFLCAFVVVNEVNVL